jgi:endoglucanase
MIVRHISDEGYLHFENIGGINPHAFLAHRVDVHAKDGPIRGVVGRTLPMFQEGDAVRKSMKPHEHWIDIGAKDGDDARSKIRIGDPVTWVAPVETLGEDLIMGAGIDDKISVFMCIEALARSTGSAAEVVVVSAVQEEVTGVGAAVAAYRTKPDLAVAVDVWPMVSDVPGQGATRYGKLKLGEGPVIFRGANSSPIVAELLIEAAEAEEIPYQLCAWPGRTPTDAASIFASREGVPTGLIGLPQRYLHTPSEVVNLTDVENCTKLLAALVARLEPGMDFTRTKSILGD